MPDYTYHPILKPLLFRLRPELGRRITLRILEIQARTAWGRQVFRFFGHGLPDESLSVTAFGIKFPSPIGLGLGIDTHGVAIPVMQHLGFGFLTVGPVGKNAVLHAYATEPLRIEAQHAIVSSRQAGAPSAAELAAKINAAPDVISPVGIALRGDDLATAIRKSEHAAGFYVLPASCTEELSELRQATRKPLLLRLSPDWSQGELEQNVQAAVQAGIDGCIAVGGADCPLLPESEICGPFLQQQAIEITSFIAAQYGDRFPVIGGGGVQTPEDALALLDAGAKMVELSAGFVYAGPGLPGRIIHALEHRLEHYGQIALPPKATVAEPVPPFAPPIRSSWLYRLGWPLVALTGAVLIASGLFALLLAATVKLLPYDYHYLGMTLEQLCAPADCRVVQFLAHDRVAFGGSIIAVGILYTWLACQPLRCGEAWAWWTLLLSGITGFGSFLTYLGYGYLDVTHGIATLLLLPVYLVGMACSFFTLPQPRGIQSSLRVGAKAWLWSPAGQGRMWMSFVTFGMILGGAIIMGVGMTRVFVPQDLEFMQLTVADLNAISPKLVPLIAHDRAGFGGGLCSGGLLVLLSLWCGARPKERGLWWAFLLAGSIGFSCAIGVHPLVGYHSFIHLLPAYLGAIAFGLALILLYRPMCLADERANQFPDL